MKFPTIAYQSELWIKDMKKIVTSHLMQILNKKELASYHSKLKWTVGNFIEAKFDLKNVVCITVYPAVQNQLLNITFLILNHVVNINNFVIILNS